MTDTLPPIRPDQPGVHGTYGQGDFAPSAQRDRFRRDQHYACRPHPAESGPDPYGAGGFAAGGEGQSGYGGDFGQLDGAQRHEKPCSERDYKKSGTLLKSNH